MKRTLRRSCKENLIEEFLYLQNVKIKFEVFFFFLTKILNPKYVCDFNFRKVFSFFGYIFQKIPCGNLFDIKIIF